MNRELLDWLVVILALAAFAVFIVDVARKAGWL